MEHVTRRFPRLTLKYDYQPEEWDYHWNAQVYPETVEITDIKTRGESLSPASQRLMLKQYEEEWIEEIKKERREEIEEDQS